MKTYTAAPAARLQADIVAGRHGLLKTIAGLAICLASCFTGGAHAQPYPSKPITMIIGFGVGGAGDAVARALGAELAADFKQQVIVDNRPGASQVVAGAAVSRAAPDGYTILLQSYPNLISPSVLKTLPYKGNTDFAPVASIATIGGVLMSSAKFPAANLKEFVSLVKSNPAKYTYGSTGIGTPLHIWLEMFHQQIGARPVHIPYKSYPDQLAALISGDIDYAFLQFNGMQFATAGKVKVLGASTSARDPDYPALPTLDEAGLKGFSATLVFTVVAPKGTPPEIVQRLNAAIAAATVRESFASKVRIVGGVQVLPPMSPAQTAELMAREEVKQDKLVKEKIITFE